MYNFTDASPAVHVFWNIMPQNLSNHFYRVARQMNSQMNNCSTRWVRTLHLGPKEYNPNEMQLPFYNGKRRVWTVDKGNTKEQVLNFLPELQFADMFLKLHYTNVYTEKVTKVKSKFRLGTTCFTCVAVNSGTCQLHRDGCLGIDLLIYGGDWIGSELVVPQLRLKIKLNPSDVIVMDSYLFHEVLTSRGHRYSMVFFTKTHNESTKFCVTLSWCLIVFPHLKQIFRSLKLEKVFFDMANPMVLIASKCVTTLGSFNVKFLT